MKLSYKKRVAIKVWQHLCGTLPHKVVTRGKRERITGFAFPEFNCTAVTGIEVEMMDVVDALRVLDPTTVYSPKFHRWRVKVFRVRITDPEGTTAKWQEKEEDPTLLEEAQTRINNLEKIDWCGDRPDQFFRFIEA